MSKKDLFIIRHAKAEAGIGMRDFDRSLSPKGLHEAARIAGRIRDYDLQPSYLVSSPAKRALGTAEIFAETLQMPQKDIEQNKNIYESDVDILLSIIHGFDNKYDRIALFGHNPEIGALAYYLGNAPIDKFPTCTVVHLHFAEADKWDQIRSRSGEIRLFLYP